MSVRCVLLFAAGLLLIPGATPAETIIDSDTAIYGTIDDDVSIVGAVADERPPVINFLDSARITGDVTLDHAAVVNLSGGTIEGRLTADGAPLSAVLNFSGGRVTRYVRASNAVVNISDEFLLDPHSRGANLDLTGSVLNMSDGSLPSHTRLNEGSIGNISGGQLNTWLMVFDSTLTVLGGTIEEPFAIDARGNGEAHVYGGEIAGTLAAWGGGTVHVYGYDLVQGDRFLTGTLADGTEISARLSIGPDSELVLHEIPEPATWLGVISGIGACIFWRWFQRS